MTAVTFEVAEHGQPALADEEAPEQQQPLDDVQAPAQVVPAGWTPEEAAAKAAEIMTTGILIGYVARHQQLPSIQHMQRLAFQPAEFPSTGCALAPFLDRFVPKGGIADVGISATAMLGELGMAIGKRWQAFSEPPPKRPGEPASTEAPTPPEPVAAAAPAATAGGTYRMPRDLVVAIPRRPDDSLGGLGL